MANERYTITNSTFAISGVSYSAGGFAVAGNRVLQRLIPGIVSFKNAKPAALRTRFPPEQQDKTVWSKIVWSKTVSFKNAKPAVSNNIPRRF